MVMKHLPWFVRLSAIGLVLSMVVHISTWLGLSVSPAAMCLHFGVFIVWIPTMIIALGERSSIGGLFGWTNLLRGAPPWLRYMCYALFFYAIVNFWIVFGRGDKGADF